MVGAEGVPASLAGHVAVESETESIEQERLAGPGGAVDEEEALFDERVEVDLDLVGVGAEGAEGEAVRPHPSSSLLTAASASLSTAPCASEASAPCWSDQNRSVRSRGVMPLRTADTTSPPPDATRPSGSC